MTLPNDWYFVEGSGKGGDMSRVVWERGAGDEGEGFAWVLAGGEKFDFLSKAEAAPGGRGAARGAARASAHKR
jgi:hypothetical protein